jgi:hypothetical protein
MTKPDASGGANSAPEDDVRDLQERLAVALERAKTQFYHGQIERMTAKRDKAKAKLARAESVLLAAIAERDAKVAEANRRAGLTDDQKGAEKQAARDAFHKQRAEAKAKAAEGNV